MKHLLLSIFVFACATTGFTQNQDNSSNLFYYFGNKKIPLQESTERIYLRLKTNSAGALKSGVRSGFQISEKAFTALQSDQFLVLSLKEDNKTGIGKNILAHLKNSNEVQMVRPAIRARDGKELLVDESFYVKLKPGNSRAQLAALCTQLNCIVESVYKYDSKTFLIKAGAANNYDGLQMANRFYESGLFVYAEPDFRMLDILHSTPNDPMYDLQWAHLNTGATNQGSGTAGADMDVDEAWDITMGSAAIRIAVLDEGVQRTHPDLINNITAAGFGLVASNATTGNILSTARSHGTACAGIIAAEANNSIGVAGVAPLSKIVPVNITINAAGNFGTSAQIAEAIDWAWNEGAADILSSSWGGGTASSLIQDAIRRATTLGRSGKGSIVIFSSGNNDAGVSSPAIFPETIAVGAVSMCNERKSPSSCDGENFWGCNYGTGLDISAPGVRIATTRVTGTGTSPNLDYYTNFNGTSAAAPMVSGVAALVLSINNQFTQQQVREILERTTRKTGGYTFQFAPGQPNGSWSSELGHGIVNAKNAVIAAQNPAFCRVEIATGGNLQVCSGGSVSIQVTNVAAGAGYQWRLNGTNISTGSSINANQSGNFDVILTSNTGCKDTSYPVAVLVSPSQGTLLANAGRDTSICLATKTFLGGPPSATGGTAILHPMRGLAADISNNRLLRFDPLQPSLYYRTITNNFIPNFAGGNFFPGAASTPTGLYMLSRLDKMLTKIDTATGASLPIGLVTAASVSLNGMTYDATTDKLFALATLGTVNQLYEINRATGAGTLLGVISGVPASSNLISLSADNAGILYAMRLNTSTSATLFRIDKSTMEATLIGNTGFLASFAQGGDVDPLTDKLYHFGTTNPLGGGSTGFAGKGLWTLNKATGQATLVGSIAQPFNAIDALSFAKPEYKYQWSPATNLSNAKDANPQFTATAAGTFTYTLTVTDLCGNTASDQVVITVNGLPPSPAISPANPVLSHRNKFTDTLTFTPQGGLTYVWLQDDIAQANTTDSFLISFANSPASQFAVRTTNPATGCVSTSNPVQFTYSLGVLQNSNDALTVCDSSFYDAGGPTGNTGSNFTRVFTPQTAGSKLKLSLYNLQLASFAALNIYDGPSPSSPRIESLNNSFNGSVLREFTASNPDGILTVEFSAGSSVSQGWLGGITCEQPMQYRTIANGAWITLSIWESKLPSAPPSAWAAATRLPNKGDETITIQHHVSLTEQVQADEIRIAAGARLELSGSGSLNIYKVNNIAGITVLQGATLQLGTGKFIFGTGGVIELQGNLDNAGQITAEDVIINGSAAQQLINNSGVQSSISKLTMNNAAGLTVQGLHQIANLQLNNGLINTSANNTFIIDVAGGGSATSYVNGVLRFLGKSGMSDKLVPIGKNGAYRPILLSANSADGEGSATLQAEVIPGPPAARTFPPSITNVSNIRHYRVSALENSVNLRDFDITLPYGPDDAVQNHTQLKVAKDDGAGAWIDLAGTATAPVSGTIKSNAFNSFSDFVLANTLAGTVPVTLVSFSGMFANKTALLKWHVQNEINFNRYEIERSINGADFSSIGQVAAQSRSEYSFADAQLPLSAIVFYRLKLVDSDGRYNYSNIIQLKVNNAITQSRIVSVSPNPFATALTLQYESSANERLPVNILDSKGRLLKQQWFNVQRGNNLLYIAGADLAGGMYLLQLKAKSELLTVKIIKQ